LQCLVYLVGDLVSEPEHEHLGNFYGSQTKISQDLGIEILHLLCKCGVDFEFKNYYDQDVLGIINTPSRITARKSNNRFVSTIQSLAAEKVTNAQSPHP